MERLMEGGGPLGMNQRENETYDEYLNRQQQLRNLMRQQRRDAAARLSRAYGWISLLGAFLAVCLRPASISDKAAASPSPSWMLHPSTVSPKSNNDSVSTITASTPATPIQNGRQPGPSSTTTSAGALSENESKATTSQSNQFPSWLKRVIMLPDQDYWNELAKPQNNQGALPAEKNGECFATADDGTCAAPEDESQGGKSSFWKQMISPWQAFHDSPHPSEQSTLADHQSNPRMGALWKLLHFFENQWFKKQLMRGRHNPNLQSSSWLTKFVDPTLLEPSSHTITDLIDKILTSTPRLLAIANFLLALTYLLHTAVAEWFLGGHHNPSANLQQPTNQNAPEADLLNNFVNSNSSHNNANHHNAIGGFLVFKLLLVSAVVAPDTLDLLILLSWYTLLSFLRSLAHLCSNSIRHASAAGQAPARGVFRLLSIVFLCNCMAAAICVGLFHAAGLGIVILLTCDCALTAVDVLAHMFEFVQAVMEVHQGNRIAHLEEQGLRQREQQQQQVSNDRDEGEGTEHEASSNSSEVPADVIGGEIHRLEERHARRVAILETTIFSLQLLAHLLTVAHFLHIWSLHGVQFTLIDGVLALHLHSAISSASKKIALRRNLHRIARDLDGVFEDASDLELRKAAAAGDVCCVCLSTMTNNVKKVGCGHIFHASCLREVVERARALEAAKCPLCRASLLDGQYHNHSSSNGNNATQPAAARGDATNAVNPGADNNGGLFDLRNDVGPASERDIPAEDQALFRLSTEGILPSWIPIPAFSFEVVRRTPLVAEGPDAGEPNLGLGNNQNPNNEGAQPQQQSLLRRLLLIAGAIPMSPEEEAIAMDQLVDMFPQYDRSDLLQELRDRGSAEGVAESILSGTFAGVPRM